MGAPRPTKSLWEIISSLMLITPGATDRVLIAPQPGTPFTTPCKAATIASIASSAASSLNIAASTYLPVASNLVNLDAVVPHTSRFQRIGSIVYVSGVIEIDATAALAAAFDLTIPVVSAFANLDEASGVFNAGNATDFGRIQAKALSGTVEFDYVAVATINTVFAFEMSYQII